GRIDDTQIRDQSEEQLGVFSAATALADAARRIQNEREEVVAQAHDIDWSDPAVLRYHTLQNRPFSIAEVRKNMSIKILDLYLKEYGIRIKLLYLRDSEIKKEVMKIYVFDLQQEFVKKDKASSFVQKQPARGSRKKSLARKRADGSVKHYKIFSAMLYDFDRQDVMELYKLVKERFQTTSPEGYDLLLWGDLKTMIETNKEDEIWRNQQDWNMINWKLHNFCGVYVLLIDTGFVIHMMVEKKYPLSQDTLSKMLSRRLEVDHQSEMGYELIRFVKSQVSTARRKDSTASTELNTARRLSTAA
ncbi:hypothetical protein Tco_1036412, partial [Tanacetum coccineum]